MSSTKSIWLQLCFASLMILKFQTQFCLGLKFQSKSSSVYSSLLLGKSKLVLFQGRKRYELEGKFCPVGLSFTKPELFSCACVTGVWAFYDQWCGPPVKVVGGFNHCFQMPNVWIQQVTVWSNPIRVLDPSLTIFEGDEASMKAKIYRNTHLTLKNVSTIVTMNSTWTLMNRKSKSRLCLDATVGGIDQNPLNDTEGIIENASFSSAFCNFKNVHEHMHEVNTFKPGCLSSDVKLKPESCDYFEDTNSESVCTSLDIIQEYEKWIDEDRGDSAMIKAHPFRKWVPTTTTTTTTTEPTTILTTPPDTTTLPPVLSSEETPTNTESVISTKKLPHLSLTRAGKDSNFPNSTIMVNPKPVNYFEDVENTLANSNDTVREKKDIHESNNLDPIYIDFPPAGFDSGVYTENPEEDKDARFSEADMLAEMKKAYESESTWLKPNKSESDPYLLTQMWMYQKTLILTTLNLKRDEELVRHASQVKDIFTLSKQIMQTTCKELIPPAFFDMAMEAFINVQSKNLRWKPPFVEHSEFLRIIGALKNCFERATPFDFRSTSGCFVKDPKKVYIHGKELDLVISDTLNSRGFEPIIETMWKVVVHAHSYCYSDFSLFYNDHHRYTTIFTPVFSNSIHEIWYRNKSLEVEYGGVAGNLTKFVQQIDQCSAASRLVTLYPWDLTRPDPDVDLVKSESLSYLSLSRKKREITEANMPSPNNAVEPEPRQDESWKKSRLTLKGLGYCLKKFDEPKEKLGQICDNFT